MKKVYIFLVLLFTVSFSFGQVLTENFSYTTGQLLTANGWSAHSGAGTNAIAVTAPGLTYSGHPGSGVGNATTMTTSGEDVNRTFTSITSGSVYMSFLLNVSAAQSTGDYFIGLFQTSSIFPLRIYAKSDGTGGYFLGISKATGAITYETTSRTFGTTYFIVANYIFNTGTTTDDVVNLWVNPALGGTEPSATIANVTGAVTDGTSAAAVYLRQGAAGNASTQQVDAILVGSTWADVTPAAAATPSLSASALTSFNNVCINTEAGPNSFTITGTNLTTANVTVAALPGFTYSTTSGGTYTSTLSLTQPGGAYSQQVFVKFNPTAVQSYNGNIVVAGGGASSSVNVAAAGAGVNSLPTVTSGAASAITQTTATVAGSITADGCSAITAYGIEYSTTSGFANGTGTAVASTNLASGAFTSALGSLTQGTTYYYHAYATNSAGTAYGAEMSFTTATPNPAITTTALTAFGNVCINTTGGPNSFTINGTSLTTANVTVAALPGFTYSTTTGGTYTTTLSLTQPGGSYSQEIFVKFDPTVVQSYDGNIVVNGGGITSAVNVAASGAGINTLPTVTAGTATAITQTTATVPGTISANGCSGVTAYGIEYSTTSGFANGTGTAVASTNLSGTSFSSALSTLTAGTTYYYHAYATNGAGTSYSTEGSFTTANVVVPGIVISQVYGGGGNASATYNQDFVELFNRTTNPIDISGWSIQYASATGPAGSGNWTVATIPASTTIAAGKYYLIALATGANGVALPVTADLTNTGINMSGTAGKIALVNNSTALNGTTACADATVVDVFGFGTATTTCAEGTVFNPTGIDNTKSMFRKNNGCTETNDNSADFEVSAVAPRNSATTANVCGAAVPALTATALTAFGNVCTNTTAGPNSFTITGTNLTTANVTVAALPGFTYSTTSGGTYTSALSLTQPGGAFSQEVFVKFSPTTVQSYNGDIVVSGGGASAPVNVAASGSGINTLPSVTSGAASAITLNSATVAGSITADGCSAVTAYGIEYSTTAGFANGTGTAVASTNLSGGNFTSALGSLTQGTTYYYHAYATNGAGTAYGAEMSFTTATPDPAITTTALTAFGNICINATGGPNSFTINGTNLTTANVTVAALPGFTYSTTAGGTYTTTLSLTQPGGTYTQQVFVKFDPTAVQSYNGNIVVNGGGIASAVNVAASGAGVNTLPTVAAGAASAITQTTATVAGSISDNGCSTVTAYGIEYSTTSGFANGTGTAVASTNLSGGNFSSALSTLTAATTYYYHAYATNAGGTSYSAEGSFTTTSTTPTTTGLVISQVYGGGGGSTGTYLHDYIELHNAGTSPVSLNGLSLQYGSATGQFGSVATNIYALPNVSVPAGAYFLVQLSAAGSAGAALPVTPDATTTNLAMSGTSGKVALANQTTALGCGASATPCTLPSSTIIDLVAYGASNNAEGGTAVNNGTALTATQGAVRKNNGCTDTDNNNNDFDVVTAPVPRNSASPINICGAAVPSLTATALTAFGNVCINTTAGPNSFTITGTNLTTANVAVAALPGFTYSTTSGGTYTSTLTLTQPGGAFSQEVFVKFNPTAVQSYNGNIVVSGGGASTSVDVAASGAGINTLPSVTSGAASAITLNSATVAGSISSDGCSAVTAYGIEYSTTAGFANGTGTAVAATNLSGGNFSSGLSGLAQGTTYYYHAYATNGGGTAYGTEMSFTTLSPNPLITATTLAAFGNVCINTSAGPNSFTINGTNLTTADVVVGPLAGYTFSTTSGGTYTATLTLTQPGGTYTQQVFVRFTPTAVQSYNGNIPVTGGGTASATNVAASGAGVNTTATVTSGAASAITTSSATVAGSITATGCSNVTVYGIEYSTTNGFPNGTGTAVASTNLSGGNFSAALSGLAASTTYYYHAYATNAGGTTYGAQQSFTTAAPVLNVTALTAFGDVCTNTTAGPNSFVISSTGLGNGAVTVAALAGYTYSTTSGGTYTTTLSLPNTGGAFNQTVFVKFNPTAVQSYNGNIVVSGGGAAAVNVAASGSGVNTTPVVVTGTASGITTNSVVLAGSTTGAGCSVITEVGFEYSGINNFTPGNGTKVVAATNTSFTTSVPGLVQGGTYYFRAYAKNAGGTTYGDQQMFTIASIPDEFVVYPVPATRGQNFRFSMPGLRPGYYGLLFYNTAGALVYQHNMNIQVNFINQSITIPATLTAGTYRLQLVDHRSVVATKSIVIAE